MPTLDWLGKAAVMKHHEEVPFHLLRHTATLGTAESGNLLVQGDNLLALKALLPHYGGQVKCIYIDPPYNTGNENWLYNDNVNSPEMRAWLGKVVGREDLSRHDKWLCMMYPRLLLLREFLREDGVIFVSIDDNEAHYLLAVLDELFDEQNRLGVLVWDLGTGTTAGHFTRAHEYVIAYAKNKSILPNFSNTEEGESVIHGALKKPSSANPYSRIEFPAGIEYEGENAVFEGEIGGSEKIRIISEKMVFENGKLKYPVILEAGWAMRNQTISWLAGNETFDSKGQKVVKFFFNKNGILWYEKEKTIVNPPTVLRKVGSTKNGTTTLMDIMKSKVFDFPKPIELVSFLLKLVTNKNDIIMDSFAGSGTTGHAVLQLNQQDGGNRRFILVEMEPHIAQNITATRLQRVIEGYTVTNDKGQQRHEHGLGGGLHCYELGDTLFTPTGRIRETVTFEQLARHVFFSETRQPLPSRQEKSPLLGVVNDKAVYLLYNGILQDTSPQGGNALTPASLQQLPPHDGVKVIYGSSCRLSAAKLQELNITFRQIPYQVMIR